MTLELESIDGQIMLLSLGDMRQHDDGILFSLTDEDDNRRGEVKMKDSRLTLDVDFAISETEKLLIDSKTENLRKEIADMMASGVDSTSDDALSNSNPYNPDDIKVRTDKMPLTLLFQMIEDGDIDLNPDFQRHLVWKNSQKSKLIESVLLRIPLPMFYFSEDKNGKLTVIDGLQRISAIYDFMKNRLVLKDLQYLDNECGGCVYKPAEGDKRTGIGSKYYRWFNMTTISVNIIDPSSPPKVKYDIFRRINTGGEHLLNQEIRNCFTGNKLRKTLKDLSGTESFLEATGRSISKTRMNDYEIILRFLYFLSLYEKDGNIDSYDGNMESSLDDFTESFEEYDEDTITRWRTLFENSMRNAIWLIGPEYAFRKIRPSDLKPGARKQLINKAAFIGTSIPLAFVEHESVKESYTQGMLKEQIANLIETNKILFAYMSNGTNGWKNLTYTFNEIKSLIHGQIKGN